MIDEAVVGRLRRAADLLLAHPFECWFYGDSIGFEGLLAATDLLADPRYAAFAHGYVRAWATRMEPWGEYANTAPGHAICLLHERTGDPLLVDAATRLARHLMERRIAEGVYVTFEKAPLRVPYAPARMGALDAALLSDAGPGTYLDCLHFDPPFLVHLGRLIGDDAMVAEGVAQALGYGRLLQDEQTSLFRHFWLERTATAHAPGWARGQGWATLGLLDVLDHAAPEAAGVPELRERFGRLAEAMLVTQRPDGHWDAVAGQPASGLETSTAAFMVAAFQRGIDHGILPEDRFGPAVERAWQACLGSLGEDGVLADVSAAVWSSTVLEHYFHVPTGFVVPWGQGPLLAAALAIRGRHLRAATPAAGPGGAG
jgi:unsaturated rhamnogalacturonyl hydrolase